MKNKTRKNWDKFSSVDLDKNVLNKDLPYIELLGKYFRFRKEISYEEAIYLVDNDLARVYNEYTIYLIKDKDDIKKEVFKRDNYTCVYCGKYGNTVDHVIPKSKGGEYSFNNLVCSCKDCNNLKDDLELNVNEFKKYRNEIKLKESPNRIDNKLERHKKKYVY